MKKRKWLLAFTFIVATTVMGQSQSDNVDFKPKMPDFIPQTPNAFELGKYGDIPVNESSGVANLSVPLHNFSTPNLSVPISLGYTTTGIKVNQVATWVGLGWNLTAGGSISRKIRGMADEDAQNRVFISNSALQALKISNPTAYYDHIAKMAQKEYADYSPDIYTFSFNGSSGSFYLNQNNSPVLIKKESEIKIERISSNFLDGFILTTPDGNKYTFSVKEETKNRMACSGGSGNPNPTTFETTSWLLSKITHPFGDEINFEYLKSTNYYYTASLSETYNENNPVNAPQGASLPPTGVTRCGNNSYVYGKILTKISSNRNTGEIEFISSKSRSDIDDYKLDEIIIKDNFNNTIKEYSLGYSQIQSTINYNGASSFVGVGGNDEKYRLFLMNVQEKDKNGVATNGKKYSFEYDSPHLMPRRLSLSQDLLGYFNGKNNYSLLPNTHGSWFNITRGDRSFVFNSAKKGILNKITYPTKGFTIVEYEQGSSAIRVKKIRSLASAGGVEKIMKYYYTSKESAILGNNGNSIPLGSDGFISYKPAVIPYWPSASGGGDNRVQSYHNFTRTEFTSEGKLPLYLTNNDQFLYNTVTIGYGENFEGGGIEKKFSVSSDFLSSPVYGEPIIGGERSNTGLLNGTLLEENHFKKENNSAQLVKSIRYKYKEDASKSVTIDNYIGEIIYEYPYNNSTGSLGVQGYNTGRIQLHSKWRSIDSIITKEYIDNSIVTTYKKHTYGSGYAGLPTTIESKNEFNESSKINHIYPTSGTLFTQHRLNKPLTTTAFQNNTQTYKISTTYAFENGLYLPKYVKTQKGTSASFLKDEVVYHHYDDKGNVTEVSKKDGTHIFYIWGYHQSQPIAKIVNATYAQVTSYVNELQVKSNSNNESDLKLALNNLRNNLPNAQVTTFTYIPLVGVSSVTDPRGYTMYYVYDNFNRLMLIKDGDEKIIKRYEYKYKNQ